VGNLSDETTVVDLAAARAARLEAERKLAATQSAGWEVSRVAEIARTLRARNNFSARIEQAFGKDV
jgi:phage protein D